MTNLLFSELSLSAELQQAVVEMGFTQATTIQAEAIPVILSGSDVLARSQTGTGKTVAFGIPAVACINPEEANVQVLVLSPTRELAHQCGEEIRKLAKYIPYVKTADILGGGDYRTQFRQLESANVVIGTPGRIMDMMKRGKLKFNNLKMVILDEADEMLNMGFREDIEVIMTDVPAERQVVLFSATIPTEILAIARKIQRDPVHIDVNHNEIALKTIKQFYAEVPAYHKSEALILLLHYYRPNRTIIFANTKSMVDELTEQLRNAGFSAEGLHGDMKQNQRTAVMNSFRQGRISILVATDVAARGIDVSDIEYVVNFDIPKEQDSYVHRIGRTGRAGSDGTAVTLCCGRQQVTQLRHLCHRTKSDISAIDIPTVADIQRADRERMLASIEKAMETESRPFDVEMIAKLMEKGFAPERIAEALLTLYVPQDTRELRDIPQAGKRSTTENQIPMATIGIDVGLSNRALEKHIVGAVTERAGLSAHILGKITIFEEYSTFDVPEEYTEEVLTAMRGCKICGKHVRVTQIVDTLPNTGRRERNPRNSGHYRGGNGGGGHRRGDNKSYGQKRGFQKKAPKRSAGN